MKKTFYTLAVLILAYVNVVGQQSPLYTQYMFNTLAVNPAYAGSRNVLSATALFRNQWVGMAGAPKTATLTIDAPLKDQRVGVGLQLYSDKLGISQTSGLVGSYAHRMRFTKGTLALGLQVSGSYYTADFTSVMLEPAGVSDDPAFANDVSRFLYNFGTGIYYNSDRFYVGLSSPELINNRFGNDSTDSRSFSAPKQLPHLYLASGYVFPLGNSFNLKPSFLVKGVEGAPIQADVNMTLWIKDILAIGAQYRTSAAVAGMVELQATPQIRLGYSYDYSTTSLKNYNSGSHEIMLRYEFGHDRQKFISPRYF